LSIAQCKFKILAVKRSSSNCDLEFLVTQRAQYVAIVPLKTLLYKVILYATNVVLEQVFEEAIILVNHEIGGRQITISMQVNENVLRS